MAPKKLLALLLAAALLSCSPVLAAGTEAPAPDDIFTLGAPSEYGELPIYENLPSPQAETAGDDALTLAPETFSVRVAPSMSAAEEEGGGTRFDPRGESYFTPIRSQGAFNTCWAMAAIGAAEFDGLKNGLLATAASLTDLSERHLVYFFSHRADDPLGNSSNDYNINPSLWITSGGNPVLATMALAGWHGAADETETNSPYSGLREGDSLDAAYAYTDELHIENTAAFDISDAAGRELLKDMIREHGGAVLCMYYNSSYLFAGSPSAQTAGEEETQSDEAEAAEEAAALDEPSDDAAPEELPTEDIAASEEAPAEDDAAEPDPLPEDEPIPDETLPEPEETAPDAELPAPEVTEEAPAETASPEETGSDDIAGDDASPEAEYDIETPALDGASDPEAVPVLDGDADDFTVCYYQNKSGGTNHEVLIVGWDDDYPAENFGYSSAQAVPAGDGAWLCRNSQGASWAGGDGYFWISYYDRSVSASTGNSISAHVTVFDFGAADNYDNNYEYDGAAVLGYVNDALDGVGVSTTAAEEGARRWYANIFTACSGAYPRGSESLKAVSTYTYRAGVPYTASVYTDLADPADPASGALAAQTSGVFPYAGYHTVVLPEIVSLEEGETFSVVFEIGASPDGILFVPSCYTNSSWYSTNETLEGQSFVSVDGSGWADCKTLRNEPNVRIKAFTDDVAPVLPFTDVPENAWYRSDVMAVWQRYLVSGMTATTYGPAGTASRAQIVAVLWRLAGEPAASSAAPFPDVPTGAWYADAVAWAAENGIVNGYANGLLRPNLAVSRQEFMTILYRCAGVLGMDVSQTADITSFPDSGDVADWAARATAWSVGSGLQNGVAGSDGVITLSPQGRVTRAQLAAFLHRFADMLE